MIYISWGHNTVRQRGLILCHMRLYCTKPNLSINRENYETFLNQKALINYNNVLYPVVLK